MQHTPYGKYPELVTYTLGKIVGSNNANLPVKATYEDNAYTRYLKERLNIQNEDVLDGTVGTFRSCNAGGRDGDYPAVCES